MLTFWRGLGLFVVWVYQYLSDGKLQFHAFLFYKLSVWDWLNFKTLDMKRIILLIVIGLVFSIKTHSQINSLSDLLYVSNLSEIELTAYLKENWEIKQPTSSIKNNKAVDNWNFVYNKNNIKQILNRTIELNLNSNVRIRRTTLINDDVNLLKKIRRQLPDNGFVLKSEEDNKFLFENENYFVLIQLKKYGFKISVY